jgi:hypothetical protein
VLVFDAASHVTPRQFVRRVHVACAAAGCRSVGVARANFWNLNATPLATDELDLVAFRICPRFAFDDASILETPEVHADLVATARELAPGRPLAVGPITLRQLVNPDAVDDGGVGPPPPAPAGLPDRYDPRQPTPLAAAWALATIAALAGAGVEALTLFETAGWGGPSPPTRPDSAATAPARRPVRGAAGPGGGARHHGRTGAHAAARRRPGRHGCGGNDAQSGRVALVWPTPARGPARAAATPGARDLTVRSSRGPEGYAWTEPRELRPSSPRVELEPLGIVRIRPSSGRRLLAGRERRGQPAVSPRPCHVDTGHAVEVPRWGPRSNRWSTGHPLCYDLTEPLGHRIEQALRQG